MSSEGKLLITPRNLISFNCFIGPKPGIEMLIDGEGDREVVKVINLVFPAPKLALLSDAHAAASRRILLSDVINFSGLC